MIIRAMFATDPMKIPQQILNLGSESLFCILLYDIIEPDPCNASLVPVQYGTHSTVHSNRLASANTTYRYIMLTQLGTKGLLLVL